MFLSINAKKERRFNLSLFLGIWRNPTTYNKLNLRPKRRHFSIYLFSSLQSPNFRKRRNKAKCLFIMSAVFMKTAKMLVMLSISTKDYAVVLIS